MTLTASSGYIGAAVTSRLLEHSTPNLKFSALVRSQDKADKLKSVLNCNIEAVVGDLSDSALVEKLASDADIVLSIASSDDLASIEAVLKGLKKRYETTGKLPTLIHTVCGFTHVFGSYSSYPVWLRYVHASIAPDPRVVMTTYLQQSFVISQKVSTQAQRS